MKKETTGQDLQHALKKARKDLESARSHQMEIRHQRDRLNKTVMEQKKKKKKNLLMDALARASKAESILATVMERLDWFNGTEHRRIAEIYFSDEVNFCIKSHAATGVQYFTSESGGLCVRVERVQEISEEDDDDLSES